MSPLLRITMGPRRFGLPLSQVGEIADVPAVHTVPGAPEAFAGLADIRGRVITLVDLGRLLGIPRQERQGAAPMRAVVLAGALGNLALLVDGPVDILRPTPAGAEEDPGSESAGGEGGGPFDPLEEQPPEPLDIAEIVSRCRRQVHELYRVED